MEITQEQKNEIIKEGYKNIDLNTLATITMCRLAQHAVENGAESIELTSEVKLLNEFYNARLEVRFEKSRLC